jgi:hypothetical protein
MLSRSPHFGPHNDVYSLGRLILFLVSGESPDNITPSAVSCGRTRSWIVSATERKNKRRSVAELYDDCDGWGEVSDSEDSFISHHSSPSPTREHSLSSPTVIERTVSFSRSKTIGLTLAPGSLFVQAVVTGAQASEAGVVPGSLVVAVNGQRCTTVTEMMRYRALDPMNIQMTLQLATGSPIDLDQSLGFQSPVPPPPSSKISAIDRSSHSNKVAVVTSQVTSQSKEPVKKEKLSKLGVTANEDDDEEEERAVAAAMFAAEAALAAAELEMSMHTELSGASIELTLHLIEMTPEKFDTALQNSLRDSVARSAAVENRQVHILNFRAGSLIVDVGVFGFREESEAHRVKALLISKARKLADEHIFGCFIVTAINVTLNQSDDGESENGSDTPLTEDENEEIGGHEDAGQINKKYLSSAERKVASEVEAEEELRKKIVKEWEEEDQLQVGSVVGDYVGKVEDYPLEADREGNHVQENHMEEGEKQAFDQQYQIENKIVESSDKSDHVAAKLECIDDKVEQEQHNPEYSAVEKQNELRPVDDQIDSHYIETNVDEIASESVQYESTDQDEECERIKQQEEAERIQLTVGRALLRVQDLVKEANDTINDPTLKPDE